MEVALLFSGLLFQKQYEKELPKRLSSAFGPIRIESNTLPFDFTTYYEEEMGKHLLRKWILFEPEISPDEIGNIKRKSMAIEQEFLEHGKRCVNIDPGYVTLSKVVLPTTKDCSHRIYLGDGIFAEVTLRYIEGCWRPQDWTYRDYRSETALDFFRRCRKFIKEGGSRRSR